MNDEHPKPCPTCAALVGCCLIWTVVIAVVGLSLIFAVAKLFGG